MKTVLLVEDSATCREHLAARLRGYPHRAVVYEATTLHEARIWIEAIGRFDLAVVDVTLPDGTGLELLPLLVRMTVVIATANPDAVEPRDGVVVVAKGQTWAKQIESILASLADK